MMHKIRTLIQILKHRKNPYRYLLGYVLVKTGLSKNITINRVHGYKLKLSKASLSLSCFADKGRNDEEDFLRKILNFAADKKFIKDPLIFFIG